MIGTRPAAISTAEVELLIHHRLHAGVVGELDTLSASGAEQTLVGRPGEEVKPGIGFADLDAVTSPVRPLSTFKKGTTCLTVQR